MEQHSLVAFYKRKSATLIFLLASIIKLLRDSALSEIFVPYELDQIHATLIGLESVEENGKIYNRNLLKSENRKAEMRKDKVLTILDSFFPQTYRFGGLPIHYKEFLSQGKTPYERSFFIDLKNSRVVLMGWPVCDERKVNTRLLDYRRSMQKQCNIAHKYENDNDFYLVLGELKPIKKISKRKINDFEEIIRQFLAESPTEVAVRKRDMYIAEYACSKLPIASTKAHNLEEFLSVIEQ